MNAENKPIDFVDALFLSLIIVAVIMNTAIMAFVKIDATMLPIYASFATASTIAPLSAWTGYRYGTSKGSQDKTDALTALAVRPAAQVAALATNTDATNRNTAATVEATK